VDRKKRRATRRSDGISIAAKNEEQREVLRMAIPDYQSLMLPLLKLAQDGQDHSLSESIDTLALEFRLTGEERKELLPSGRQAKFDNRVGWARTYLKKAGLLESTGRAKFRITERGLEALRHSPTRIDNRFLMQYPEFAEFQNRPL
jgi:restriction system protein